MIIVRKTQNQIRQWLNPKPQIIQSKNNSNRPGIITDRPMVTLVVGRKGSGKSHLVVELLMSDWCGVYHDIITISPTFQAQFKNLWSRLSPRGITVHEAITDEFIEQLLKQTSGSTKHTLLLLDDLGEDLRKMSQTVLNKLVSNSRHYRLSILSLHQKLTQAPTILRANCDSFISFASCSYLEREALWREISTVNKKDFNRMFAAATQQPHSFMVSTIDEGGSLVNYHADFCTVLT